MAHETNQSSSQKRTPVILVLDHLRSAFNVGNIFRLAETTQIEKVVTCGYTATPPHPKLAKTARGCDDLVPCEHFASAGAALTELKQKGYSTFAVETTLQSNLFWDAPLRLPAAFVLGNEALGISPEAEKVCDFSVCLPCYGTKNSINVGNCAAVILYETLRRVNTNGIQA